MSINSHSFSTHHFLLKFIYKACSVSGHVYVSYWYRFYLYIYLCAIFTYLSHIRTDLISISYKQRYFVLISSEFDMYCRGCNNIPFWRWLKRNQTFSTSVTCYDFDEKKLSNLQSNQVCSGEYLCTLSFESIIKFIVYTLKISTCFSMKNSLKMPKKKSEAVIRRTNNTMAK